MKDLRDFNSLSLMQQQAILVKWNTRAGLWQLKHKPESTTNYSLSGLTQITPKIIEELEEINKKKPIEDLFMGFNEFDQLPENLFVNLTDLKWITVSDNSLKSLPPHIFKNLRKLKSLDLRRNQIQKVADDQFNGLDSLNFIHLDDNHIQCLSLNIFSALNNLSTVSFGGNFLPAFIDVSFFVGLKDCKIFKGKQRFGPFQ